MFSPIFKKTFYTLLSFTLVFSTGSSIADDTEIYFSTGSSTGNVGEVVRPNLLFMLDTSGSMSLNASGESPPKDRLQVLREAMTTIISGIEDVNLGLMRFSSVRGGPILFPVTYIDAPVGGVPGESAGTVTSEERIVQISSANNDAEEVRIVNAGRASVGDVNLVNTKLSFFSEGYTPVSTGSDSNRVSKTEHDGYKKNSNNRTFTGANYGNTVYVRINWDRREHAFYFEEMNIPLGAEITSAKLTFRNRYNSYGKASARIRAQNIGVPATIGTHSNDIGSRTRTTAFRDWTNMSNANNNDNIDIESTDFSNVIQELVCYGAPVSLWCPDGLTGFTWAPNNDIVIIIKQLSGYRSYHSFDSTSDNNQRPMLTVGYKVNEAADEEQTVGLRFENVRIPQGATIKSAKLTFTPSADSVAGVTPIWDIYGEKTGKRKTGEIDSAAFSNAHKNITKRLKKKTDKVAKWSVPAWTQDVPVTTTDTDANNTLVNVVQELVNQADFCGGDPMTFIINPSRLGTDRVAHSYESDSAKTVKFTYTYDAGAGGCFADQETAQVSVSGDDAEENNAGAVDTVQTGLTLGVDKIGVRFQNIDVPKNATILSASLSFASLGASVGAATFTIKGENTGNANIFSSTPNDITSRSLTTGVDWTPDDWTVDAFSDDTEGILGPIVSTITSRADWVSGNSMVFVIEPKTGASREAISIDSDPARAPRLTITYAADGTSGVKTVRERLLEIVANDLPAHDGTPLTKQLYEAALYWRAGAVDAGKTRPNHNIAQAGTSSNQKLSHPGSYCTAANNCPGATISASTNEFGVLLPRGCNDADDVDSDCSAAAIQGSPKYISPFNSTLTCQNNYQILLTDGTANSSSSTTRSNIRTITGENFCQGNNDFLSPRDSDHDYTDDEKCSVDLTKYLNENDQSTATVGTNLDSTQTVTTYSIAFDLNSAGATQFLKDIAQAGGGKFFNASSASALVDTFTSILADVKSDPTSFVAPALATNAFNRLLSRDEVYFGLFTPSPHKRWIGNVKKYNSCIDSSQGCALGSILDANGTAAIDAGDDKFKETAVSVWSSVADGRLTQKGGAGAEITDYTQTILYTDVNDSGAATPSTAVGTNVGTSLNTAGFKLLGDASDWKDGDHDVMRAAICSPASTTDNSDCHDRMHWLLGKLISADTINDPSSDISATQRWAINDVLHSSPAVITYGGIDDDSDGNASEPEDTDGVTSTFFDKIVFGTNDGMLHMVNGFDGKEDWRFLPNAFLTLQQTMFNNPEATPHPYGLDLTPTIYSKDNDGDGKIETADSDFVHVYVGARRGGKFVYALNLTDDITSTTDKVIPKFMWKIEGGVTTGYGRLGYTFSQPRLATIATTAGAKDVLIFGGGWDTTLDTASIYTPAENSGNDFLGNAIYIADPGTGNVIMNISGSGSGADIPVPEMQYSIPSRVTLADSDGDGLTDKLYVGDTGGQVWRVDLGSDIQDTGGLLPTASCTGACTKTVVGRLASLSTPADSSKRRRFFEPPSVVQVRDTQFSNQSDYDYVLIGSGYRAHPLDEAVEDRFYALRDRFISRLADADDDRIAEAEDLYADGSGVPIIDVGGTNLIDLTDQVLADADITTVKDADGWFYDFKVSNALTGEKVLSAPMTTARGVTFTTFKPSVDANASACQGSLGNATAYNFNIKSGNAFLNWDGTGGITKGDRKLALGGGIPSDVVPIFTEEGVVGIVGIEGGASQLGVLSGLPRFRTYYYEDS